MKKRTVLILAVLMILSSLIGCAKPAPKDFLIDSKNYFEIGVPYNSKVWFQAPWYRVSTQDYLEDSGFNARMFTVGQDAELIGTNVDQLNGATITVSERNLKDQINAYYYRDVFLELNHLQGTKPTRNQEGNLRLQDIAKVWYALNGCAQKAKVLSFNLGFYGEITKDVQIDSIRINSIHYQAAFQSFHITSLAIPDNQSGLIYEQLDSGSFGGVNLYSSMSQAGYCFLEGVAKAAIRDIQVEGINDSCIVLDKTNYSDFVKYSDNFFEQTINGRDSGPFAKGDEINLKYDYVYLGKAPEEFKQYDSAIASLRYIVTLEDGTELNSYTYQSSVRAPEYVLVRLLLNNSK
jgi:hypothetical protein